MSYLFLVRHGQSEWNLKKKFTGWVDIDLTAKGKLEAYRAGELIKNQEIKIDYYFVSFQLRAKNTLRLIQETLRDNKEPIKAWQLNERHYGALTGLNKNEMEKKLGLKKIYEFRRSWNIKPEPLSKNSPFHPLNINTYKIVPKKNIPDTESLKDTYDRVIEYFENHIKNKLLNKENVLISAHGNSLRALCKYLFKLNEERITKLEIPTGNPLLIKFEEDLDIKNCYYLDKDRSKDLLVF